MNRPVVVNSNMYVLAGGMLTHDANAATEANKIDLTVRGDMNVDANASVDVTGKGYAAAKGPGSTGGESCSASYGGFGAIWYGSGPVKPCYGSILAPANLGSGGGSAASGSAGGGGIKLALAGALCHNGLIVADGAQASGCAGSGGSIILISGGISGSGTIRANGGWGGRASGGGGRIALVVTNKTANFLGLAGPVTAFGGSSRAGAGTIYRQCSADRPGRGSVWINNNGFLSGITEVPPATNYVSGEVDRIPFFVTNAAQLRITNDFLLGDIWLQSTNACLDLGSNTLTVRSKAHALGLGVVTNFGAIVWWPYIPKGTIYFAK